MDSQQTEAYKLVCKLNNELFKKFGEHVSNDFQFVTSKHYCAILWQEVCVWDSENYPSHDDEDNPIPIKAHVRLSMQTLAQQAEWVASEHCCDLDCMGDGGANACLTELAPNGDT